MTIRKYTLIKVGLFLLVIFISISYLLSLQSGSLIFYDEYSRDFEYKTNFQKSMVIDKVHNNNISVWELLSQKSTEQYLLYLPGNGGISEIMFNQLAIHYNVVGVAYLGYHESESKPTPKNTLSAADTAYNWMINSKKILPINITILGHSLGGAPATYIASKYNNAKQLVLINTFSSIQSMCVRSFTIFCGFTGCIFNTAVYAEKVTIPVKIFSYKNDDVIPFNESEKLYKYFYNSQNKEFISMEQYSHNDLDFDLIFDKITRHTFKVK